MTTIPIDDDNSQSLSIVSVAFPDSGFLEKNLRLTNHLNPRFKGRWIVVDNTPKSDLHLSGANVDILPGVPRMRSRDLGSLHHAASLEKALREVRTRFVLFMDPDFYVLRKDWIATLLSHVRECEIGIFGSVWNPRWFYQYRDFPSVHFMLIDLERIPVTQIDLKPLISEDRWWQIIVRGSTPWPNFLRDTLKAQRCRDTGWQLYRRFGRNSAVRVETLLPHYVPPADSRYRWERRLAFLLPNSWCKYPPNLRSYTEQSFLRERFRLAYEQGWEEFFWQAAPFAIHLRRVGRSMLNVSLPQDEALLGDCLKQLMDQGQRGDDYRKR